MKRLLLACLLVVTVLSIPLRASNGVIVRVNVGTSVIKSLCNLLGCKAIRSLGDPQGSLFLVTSDVVPVAALKDLLSQLPGVVSTEIDLQASFADQSAAMPGLAVTAALTDLAPTSYAGSPVMRGYLTQPATGIIRLFETQNDFKISGGGTVAVIDTGVDTTHPALTEVLLPGYDFTRNQAGADEKGDLLLMAVPSLGPPNQVNQNASANLDQSTAAVVDGNGGYSDFGHGTMVAGLIHLVAPSTHILPLKAFGPNGRGYNSDIVRAIYAAVAANVQVINMSFNLAAYSQEIKNAIAYASSQGVICVAAAGNDGHQETVYPASLTSYVVGVGSTTNSDQLSSFSNYGPQVVWVAAPGEGIVSTYPFATYASSSGTSFSAPLVSGTAALLVQIGNPCDQYNAAQSVAHAVQLTSELGNGRLDTHQAASAWRQIIGFE